MTNGGDKSTIEKDQTLSQDTNTTRYSGHAKSALRKVVIAPGQDAKTRVCLQPSPQYITNYYPGQKNRYSREIHEVDLQFDHVISCDIELRFDINATRGSCASRVALQIEVNVARYHMIALQINLMNISAVTIFLARVVKRGYNRKLNDWKPFSCQKNLTISTSAHMIMTGRSQSFSRYPALMSIMMKQHSTCTRVVVVKEQKLTMYSLFHAPFNTLEHRAVQCSKELSASAAHPRGMHASNPCSFTVDPINWLAESVLWTVKARPIFHTASTSLCAVSHMLWQQLKNSVLKVPWNVL